MKKIWIKSSPKSPKKDIFADIMIALLPDKKPKISKNWNTGKKFVRIDGIKKMIIKKNILNAIFLKNKPNKEFITENIEYINNFITEHNNNIPKIVCSDCIF